MGEAKRKSRSRAQILAGEPRCIYCKNVATSVDHMPPKAMFKGKSRPSGMEFASCGYCNSGTSAAELVASFFARLSPFDERYGGAFSEAAASMGKLTRSAPGVIEELARPEKKEEVWLRGPGGILRRTIKIDADGPLLNAHLTVFAAKLGMALYREHVGEALPLNGVVLTQCFLNAGLAQSTADIYLRILPLAETLRQGTFQVKNQFAYRFNTDKRSVVAALATFHSNFHVFVIATTMPALYEVLKKMPHSEILRPGELVARMPKKAATVPKPS